jgi:hypothetical protein
MTNILLPYIHLGKAWEQQLEWNPKTFEDVYNMNTNADPIKIENESSNAHSKKWKSIVRSESTGIQEVDNSPQQKAVQQTTTNSVNDHNNFTISNMEFIQHNHKLEKDESFWMGFTVGTLSVLAVIGTVLSGVIAFDKYNSKR